ncbi:MAG: o-succinylbenzoate synthase [Myxococcota bacterium]
MTLELSLVRKQRALTRTASNARGRWLSRESIELCLSDVRLSGWGEAAPLPGYSDDTLEQAETALSLWMAPVQLAHIEQLAGRGTVEPHTLIAGLSLFDGVAVPSARFALETAVLALVAARRQQPLHELLRAMRPATAFPEMVPLAQLIELEMAERDAEVALGAGFSTLKFKIGRPGAFTQEIAALTQLRTRFGFGFALRLDANRSLRREQARDYFAALAPLRPEFVEEPLLPDEVSLEDPEIPIALDESLRQDTVATSDTWLAQRVAALVLKPTALGGFGATFRLVDRARELGIAPLVSHTFEGPLAYHALCALALAMPPSRFAHGLGPHSGLDSDASELGLRHGKLWAASPSLP